MVTKIGLDLGYANITLSDVTTGVYREPSIALIDKDSHRIISVGNQAMMGGDETASGMLVRPFKNGLLFDHRITESVISNAIKAVLPAERVRCVVGVPGDFLPKQEKELFEMLAAAGATQSFSVSRSLAALVGAGYSPLMSVISVNVGASSTEILVTHKGTITYVARESVGGEDFDKAVKQYILEQGDVNVSLSVARAIKEKLGSVWSGRASESVDIEGTLSLTGNRVHMSVTTEDIVGVFEKPLHKLLKAVADAVKRIPLDYVEDVFKNGIVLSGGGALLYGIDTMMSKVLGVSVTVPDEPMDSVAKGLSRINTFIPMHLRTGNKNVTAQVAKYYESKKSSK